MALERQTEKLRLFSECWEAYIFEWGGRHLIILNQKKVAAASKMIILGRSIDLPGMRVILNCVLTLRKEPRRNAKGD